MKWYIKVLKDYVTFSGRARRSEYWSFVLFNMIFAIAAMVIDNMLGTKLQMNSMYGSLSLPYGYIYLLYTLAVFIPSLAVLVRRLHDIGKSGWWFFIVLIPIVGWIWIVVLLFNDSNAGENKYGVNPKSVTV